MKGIIISSDKSNSGKTTISLALMKILSKYGKVRGYKVGPDFIDPKFHELATGYPSINLDYFISGKMVKDYFLKYGRGFDYGIVEGVMGLYDGLGGDYSTYHISRYLGLPIIIVMDCGFNSTTASAIIYGLKYFGNADIRGVIFNNVASRSHHHDCAIKLPPGVMDLGYIKHDNEINIKSRHLGLYLPDSSTISKIKRVSDIVEEQIDINSLISIMENFEIAEDKDQINTDSMDKPKAASFMSYLLPSDILKAPAGKAIYSAYLNRDGKMIDDTIAYKISNESVFVIPNAATTEKIHNWLIENSKGFEVNIINFSDKLCTLALQGPLAKEVMNKIYPDANNLEHFTFMNASDRFGYKGLENVTFIARTGYTGEDGFEFIIPNQRVVEVWKLLLNDPRVKPIGLGARDTLRMEKGFLLSGQDFNEDRTPIEAGISWIVDFDHNFIGKDKLLENKNRLNQRFRGLIALDKSIPRSGTKVYLNGDEVGILTSGGYSPTLGKGIGLGYIDQNVKVDTEVELVLKNGKGKGIIKKPRLV